MGSNVTYTLTVTNNGPSAANGVVVSNVVPAGVNLISFNSSQGSRSNAGGVVVYGLGTVPAGTNATMTVVVQALATGNLTNVASMVRAEPDAYTPNNRVVSVTAVQGALALSAASPGVIELRFNDLVAGNCVIETSTDLKVWKPLSTNNVVGGRVLIVDPEMPQAPQRFYRARLQQ